MAYRQKKENRIWFLLVKTTSFGALFVVHPAFLCTIESPKITISQFIL